MKKPFALWSIGVFGIIALLLIAGTCGTAETTQPSGEYGEDAARQTAEEFVRSSPTFVFDGTDNTLKLVETLSPDAVDTYQFIYSFESTHAGYGDRSGDILAQVITFHECNITVEKGEVTSAIMDERWDMLAQSMVDVTEIRLAPIHEVSVVVMESYPEQIGVNIKLGLSDGCTTFHDAMVSRDGYTVNITVTTQRPANAECPAVYTYYEKNLNLGSDFERGATYTLHVNDYITTFTYPE